MMRDSAVGRTSGSCVEAAASSAAFSPPVSGLISLVSRGFEDEYEVVTPFAFAVLWAFKRLSFNRSRFRCEKERSAVALKEEEEEGGSSESSCWRSRSAIRKRRRSKKSGKREWEKNHGE